MGTESSKNWWGLVHGRADWEDDEDQKLRVSPLLYSEVQRGCESPIPTKQACPVRPWQGHSPASPPSQSTSRASGSILKAEGLGI